VLAPVEEPPAAEVEPLAVLLSLSFDCVVVSAGFAFTSALVLWAAAS
jgi:hypothetical protein